MTVKEAIGKKEKKDGKMPVLGSVAAVLKSAGKKKNLKKNEK